MRWLDALCEGSFVRGSDGVVSFFPWGGLGRGYAIPSEERYRRLRRTTRGLLGLGLFVSPLVASVAMQRLGLRGAAAVGLAFALGGALRLASLARGLEPSAERLSRAESRARVLAALRRLRRGS